MYDARIAKKYAPCPVANGYIRKEKTFTTENTKRKRIVFLIPCRSVLSVVKVLFFPMKPFCFSNA